MMSLSAQASDKIVLMLTTKPLGTSRRCERTGWCGNGNVAIIPSQLELVEGRQETVDQVMVLPRAGYNQQCITANVSVVETRTCAKLDMSGQGAEARIKVEHTETRSRCINKPRGWLNTRSCHEENKMHRPEKRYLWIGC